MSPSRTRCIGMEVYQATMAVAYGAQEHGAEVPDLGPMGTRQCALEPLGRTRPSPATQLVLVYDAGPCGAWRSRSLRHQGHDCWVGAPSLLPHKAGDRVHTARRDAGQLARLARSGDLTAVSVPTVADEAMRARSRARAETRSALTDAKFRLNACWLRHDLRSTGRATGGPAPRRWLSAVICPPPAPPLVCHA
jgi:transposase